MLLIIFPMRFKIIPRLFFVMFGLQDFPHSQIDFLSKMLDTDEQGTVCWDIVVMEPTLPSFTQIEVFLPH